MVLNSKVHHEIGTHTFSQIVVDDPDCTRDIFRSQIAACVELHHRWGLNLQFNLGSDANLFAGLEAIFTYASQLRDPGRLEIFTMQQVGQLIHQLRSESTVNNLG